MNKTLLLSKVMMKMHFSWSTKSDGQKAGTFLVGALFIPLLLMWFWFLDSIIGGLYQVLSPAGLSPMILAISLIMVSIVLLFTSLPSILTSFFFSEDIETYIPLPMHPYQIIFGKSIGPLVTVYGFALFGLGPVFLLYGMYASASIGYFFTAIGTLLLFPIVPYVVAGLLMMVVMRYANISKNKDRTKVIAGIFSLIFIIGINIVIRLNQDPENVSKDVGQWLTNQEHTIWNTTKFIPNAFLATEGLNGQLPAWQSLLAFIGFVAFTIISAGVFLFAGQKLYYHGVRGVSGGGKGKKAVDLQRNNKTRKPFWSYTWKEIKIVFRTPSFFINCVIQNLFAPIFLAIMLFLDNGIGELTGEIGSVDGKYIILGMVGFTLFILGTNPTSTTAISREGRSWFTNLYMPIKPSTILFSKALAAFFIQGISLIILFFLFAFVIHIPLVHIILWVLLALGISWFSNLFGVYLDAKQPKLEWSDEQQVFKARFVPLQSMLIQAFCFGLFIFVLWVAPFKGTPITATLLFAGIGAAIYITQRLLYHVAINDFHKIQ
ncbi:MULTISPECIES: putative ABC transporter permease subunit [Pontibacillus]|uniref:ABC transporter permease n=1 Tax=Pontibacillus chungwhensis TaxID=265426 RepID=A0ABY8UZU8_9BACI|nr:MULTISPECIES: ABC transporter permease [Pontibacillus]MCD5324909.1 ABC transporter permease [Pontibacillus sp. HN14]WIF98870.1 ABC transporter permease [Pontibacillus chungwhensis]